MAATNAMETVMRIAVVGATGRIGARLTRTLLGAGHQVKALSRGGPALDALVRMGAEPLLGSFDTGAGELDRFFQDADAAFLMVKTDWNNIHGHYPEVALRFFDALRGSPVRLAVSLTAMGAEVRGSTGHFQPFYQLEQVLNRLQTMDLVHLRAGWFMENLFMWTDAIAKHGRIGWSLDPDVKTPWVATEDIADLAARELTHPTGQHRMVRELGMDFTMSEMANIIGTEIGRPVEYRFVDRRRREIEAEFLRRFGTSERWLDDSQTLDALNDGRVRFHDDRSSLPTTMEAFVRDVWKPHYLAAITREQHAPENFVTWSARKELDVQPTS
ncbi:NmrA family NAD(P)-binding protein [Roseomonas elaeocarpi]|uniref:NmrA family NAD(P)-binding protein n=1 Tax=Roseomonas elaeocarpi TaxID=907779 RepID=A0ABV6JMS5_9PROT